MAALRVARGNGSFGLIHELLHLIHHLLLVWVKLAFGDLLKIFFGCRGKLFGRALVRRLFRRGASDQLYHGLLGTAVADYLFRRRTGFQWRGAFIRRIVRRIIAGAGITLCWIQRGRGIRARRILLLAARALVRRLGLTRGIRRLTSGRRQGLCGLGAVRLRRWGRGCRVAGLTLLRVGLYHRAGGWWCCKSANRWHCPTRT